MNKILKAVGFANTAHKDQKRKYTGRPYIEHPLRVMARCMREPWVTEDMACAAVLHDVPEDTKVSLNEIYQEFGSGVYSLVRDLTNPSKQFPEKSRRERKKLDLEHIKSISAEAKLIKTVDRLDNLGEIPIGNKEAIGFLRAKYLRESIELSHILKDYTQSVWLELSQVLLEWEYYLEYDFQEN